MSVRAVFMAFPAALAAVAGLACLTSAAASNGGFDGLPQIAQATPPAASPPAAGGGPANTGPERVGPAFSPKAFCEERGVPYYETGMWDSYRQVLGALDAAVKPLREP